MDDRHYRKRLISIVAVMGGVLAVGYLFVTLSAAGRDIVGGPGSILGWAIPVCGLFTIAAITWLLLVSDHRADEDATHNVACWSCQRSVMSEWRMCPYCGAELRVFTPTGGESLDRG